MATKKSSTTGPASLEDQINLVYETHVKFQESQEDSDSPDNILFNLGHDKPDPDCMASMMAEAKICDTMDIHQTALYNRDSGFYQNLAMMNLLNLKSNSILTRAGSMLKSEGDADFEAKMKANHNLVLTDVSFISDQFPHSEHLKPSLIIDHHDINGNSNGLKILRIKPDAGANSSFYINYFMKKGIPIDSPEDSALRVASYYGIETDTANFLDDLMKPLDKEAKMYLESILTDEDEEMLAQIRNPGNVALSVKRAYGLALSNLKTYLDGKLAVYIVPEIKKKESGLVPYITDRLFTQDKIADSVIVFGASDVEEDGKRYIELIASGRSIDPIIDVVDIFGETFYTNDEQNRRRRRSGGQSGGGFSRAGATVPLSYYVDHGDRMSQQWDLDWRKYFDRIDKNLELSKSKE